MRRLLAITLLSLAPVLSASVAQADHHLSAKVYVVHGINGLDLGLAEAALPVDISVNGGCVLEGFTFGEVAGPLTLPAASYDVAVRLADADDPCTQPAVIAATVPLEAGKSYSIVAHLDENGVPVAGLFEENLAPTPRGKSRVIAHHTAWAPAVDVTIQRDPDSPKSPKVVVEDFANGDAAPAEIRPGDWYVSIAPAGADEAVFGPAPVELKPYTGYLVYAVGSVANGTFQLIIKDVPGLKGKKHMGKRKGRS